MKLRPPRSTRNFNLIACLALGVAAAISGCSTQAPPPRQWGTCGIAGGVVGTAAGAGAGLGIAFLNKAHPDTSEIAAPTAGGAVIGGIIGAVLGHEICDPLIPPPPPPPSPPPPPPPPPPLPPPAKHEKLVLRGVHFDFNKSKIRPGDAAILDEAVEILKSHPDVNIYVDGYCDAIGSEEYNLKLSQRRADAVAQYLEEHGIAASRLIPRGFGKTDFVASNDTDGGRAQNRRVELVPTE
jgi:outer membrane protein OmpA-like peptidoglycan-associated protein